VWVAAFILKEIICMETELAAPSPDSAPLEVDSAFQPLPSEVREHDRVTYDGSYRESHPDAHSAAAELVRKRKEAADAKTAVDALREAVADSDIEEVAYQPGREPDENLTPLRASRDIAEFRQTKAEAQKEQAAALLQELAGSEQQQPAELAQQPQPEPAEQQTPEAAERTAAQLYATAAENYGMCVSALLHGSQQALADSAQAANEFQDLRSPEDFQRLAQTDPARAKRFHDAVQRHQDLRQREQALAVELGKVRAQQQQVAIAQYAQFARAHDRACEELIPEMRPNADPAVRRNLQQASKEILYEAGFSDAELNAAWNNGGSFHLRDARAQKILADAARWRLAQAKAKTASIKPVPPVQRPGVSGVGPSHAEGELNAISQRLTRSGSIKDATELRKAMLAQRNRT
jgi:hypothetical protein